MLSIEAKALADAIRAVRPAVIAGSNYIPRDSERATYYALVTAAASHLWPKGGPRANNEFFDLCGIPD